MEYRQRGKWVSFEGMLSVFHSVPHSRKVNAPKTCHCLLQQRAYVPCPFPSVQLHSLPVPHLDNSPYESQVFRVESFLGGAHFKLLRAVNGALSRFQLLYLCKHARYWRERSYIHRIERIFFTRRDIIVWNSLFLFIPLLT